MGGGWSVVGGRLTLPFGGVASGRSAPAPEALPIVKTQDVIPDSSSRAFPGAGRFTFGQGSRRPGF
ncbi:hypothetical protein [Mixta calida]|uniref:hypothetical protein n=1 Tax=Mixta calida TaxID=665913 RepID=UPI00403B3718